VLLQDLLKIGGITALAIGVFYLLYRQVLQMTIFQQIGKTQTFALLVIIVFLVWSIVIASITGSVNIIFNKGNNVLVHQSATQ
jgi:hypothetical protein